MKSAAATTGAPLHVPVLRMGKTYESLDQSPVADHRSGAILAHVSQVAAGMVRRDMRRDEALRRRPCEQYPWDGVGEVRPFGASEQKSVEGGYYTFLPIFKHE